MSLREWYYPQAAAGGDEKTAEPYFKNPDYAAQVKADGARYILHKDEEGLVRIYSRHISKRTGQPVLKTNQLKHIADEFDKRFPAGTVLDGEVCDRGTSSSSNLVTKVTGATPEKALAYQQEHGFLEYRVFDILAYKGEYIGHEPLSKRYELLSLLCKTNPSDTDHIDHMRMVTGESMMRSFYQMILKGGGEGVILKDLNAPYYQGERNKSWIKVKRKKTFDVVFMGVELAKETSVKKGDDEATATRIAGQVGAIRFGQYISTPYFDSSETLFPKLSHVTSLREIGTTSGFDDALRADLNENWEKYVGRVFEVEAQEQFSSGALRHPRFKQWRDDKTATECLFRGDEG